MKEYAKAFYRSTKWRKASALYMASRHYICERCGGVGTICHHRKYIRPGNINDESITLNPDNLECLCQECHNREHLAKESRAIFDDAGRMVGAKESAGIVDYKRACEAIRKIDFTALRKRAEGTQGGDTGGKAQK